MLRDIALAALLFGGCDYSENYFLMGAYTGRCDEPTNIYGDGGDPETLRKAQCQVEDNICCRKPDKLTKEIGKDHQTYCLRSTQCYLANQSGACLGDVDCVAGLTCTGADRLSSQMGTCECPNGGSVCNDSTALYCCVAGTLCGQGQCVAPTPDASVLPDLLTPPPPDAGSPDASHD